MTIRYKKLWKLVAKNKMNGQDLAAAAAISTNSVTKLEKNETFSLDVLMWICKVFHCDIGDVLEFIEE